MVPIQQNFEFSIFQTASKYSLGYDFYNLPFAQHILQNVNGITLEVLQEYEAISEGSIEKSSILTNYQTLEGTTQTEVTCSSPSLPIGYTLK